MYHPDTNSANNGDCSGSVLEKNKDSKLKLNNMEDVFIQSLITRSYNETDLLDKLPEDIKELVIDKINEVENEETTVNSELP